MEQERECRKEVMRGAITLHPKECRKEVRRGFITLHPKGRQWRGAITLNPTRVVYDHGSHKTCIRIRPFANHQSTELEESVRESASSRESARGDA